MDLEVARDALRASMRAGEAPKCPCCTQTAKIYARGISAVMAAQLIQLNNARKPVHYKKLRNKAGGDADYAKLRYWGLIIQRPCGFWEITDRGIAFAHGRIDAPQHAMIFNGVVMGLSSERCTIRDCLGNKFDYDDLMKHAPVRRFFTEDQPTFL